MKKILFIIFLFSFSGINAQVTSNPKIRKKSTTDVFINKVEITKEQTIFSMQFNAKTAKEMLKEYLDNNPDEKEQLQRMNPMMRNMILQQYLGQVQGNSISFQPSSYVSIGDGKKYKFLKAENIPTAPNRQDAEPGKKYFFKVYFEKIPKGYETIDLVENKTDREKSFTYWNFFGIKIINPDGKNAPKTIAPEVEEEENDVPLVTEFKLFGKVLDAETNKPIAAKIICLNRKTQQLIDSVQTSKSGYYEFLINDEEYLYKISSEGYENIEETFEAGAFFYKGSFNKDVFLEPKKETKIEAPKEEVKVEPKAEEPKVEIGEKVSESSFKLDKVYFNLGESTVLPESYEQLDNLVNYLKDNSELKIQIEGHTDNQGDAKENKKLSLERAFSVREYLVRKGIDGKRIKFIGLGDKMPISSNDTEENRKLNRRVEYKILK